MYVRESVRWKLSIFPFQISTGFILESPSCHKFSRDCNVLGISSDIRLYSTQKKGDLLQVSTQNFLWGWREVGPEAIYKLRLILKVTL